jgi:hypothetical protein
MQIMSAFSATMMAESMQRIPGNQNFLRRFEFGTVIQHYFGRAGFIAGQIVLNICLQANNIASIVVAAQVLDDFLVYTFKASFAFDFAHFKFLRSDGAYTSDNPFTGHIWIISLGYVIAMAICIPFGFLNLDDNMWFQWFSFAGMMLSFIMFYIVFFLAGAGVISPDHAPPPPGTHNPTIPPPMNVTMPAAPFANHTLTPPTSLPLGNLQWDVSRVPVFGSALSGQANVIGTIVFMSAFVTTVPSWVNEKMPHVSINKSIWSSTITSNIIKMSFGYLAAITYANRSHSSNILNVISRNAPPGAFGVVTRISVYLFNFATIIPGIPVFSIMVRYNLVTGKLCPPWVANLIGVVAPWVVSMFFYHGKGLSIVVNWSAILFQGFVNFALPGLLFYFAVRWYPNFPNVVQERDPEPPVAAINDDEPTMPMERTIHTARQDEDQVNLENDDPESVPVNGRSTAQTPDREDSATPSTVSTISSNDSIPRDESPLLGASRSSNGSHEGAEAEDPEKSCCEEQLCEDPELAVPSGTPGWFFANQSMKLRPVDALPRSCSNVSKSVIALLIVAVMTVLVLTALILDFYFLAKHEDIVDG